MPETPAVSVPGTSSSPTSNLESTAETVTTFAAPNSPPPEYISDVEAEAGTTTTSEQVPLITPSIATTGAPANGNNNSNSSSSAARHSYRPTIMDNLFRFSLPNLPSSQAIRTAGVYISGALFSLGFWFFIDASVYSKVNNPSDVHIKFVDWIPGICSGLGMLVINSIEKSRLTNDTYSYSSSDVAWKARLVLFLGFALMAGGLAGSVAVLVLKYIVEQYEFETMYFGIANVIANSLIMLSAIVLWVSQNMEDDYAYRLAL